MSGIVFLKSQSLPELKQFYSSQIDCRIWLEQADCIIFQHGNFLFGFCRRDSIDTGGLLTFFYDNRQAVDTMYQKLKDVAISKPVNNDTYDIYQFFAHDPEGRQLEFQYFNHPVSDHLSGGELLLTRRSIRQFKPDEISDELLMKVMDLSRFAPTSWNTQSYYFKIIKDKNLMTKLSAVRGSSSKPIANAPAAVAIVSDPTLTKRVEQDGCIAAYHFILAAWHHGLGTCWIAAMDRDDVKEMLNIPQNHYIATITPLGHPATWPVSVPERKNVDWFLR
jgi:nitroreductase